MWVDLPQDWPGTVSGIIGPAAKELPIATYLLELAAASAVQFVPQAGVPPSPAVPPVAEKPTLPPKLTPAAPVGAPPVLDAAAPEEPQAARNTTAARTERVVATWLKSDGFIGCRFPRNESLLPVRATPRHWSVWNSLLATCPRTSENASRAYPSLSDARQRPWDALPDRRDCSQRKRAILTPWCDSGYLAHAANHALCGCGAADLHRWGQPEPIRHPRGSGRSL